nr:NADH dehydrogenase subunit 6 [Vignadula atrata]
MLLVFLVLCSVSLMSLIVTVSQPLFLCFMLGIMAVLVSFVLGSQCSSLTGFFVFLIYIGGLMVLFGYVLSIFPNQRFSTPRIPSKLFLTFLFALVGLNWSLPSGSVAVVGDFMGYVSSGWMYIFIGLLLLYALLLVVIMCDKGRVPLRSGLSEY